MRGFGGSAVAWLTVHWTVSDPFPPTQQSKTIQINTPSLVAQSVPVNAVQRGASVWLSAVDTSAVAVVAPPSKEDITLLRQAFSEFYSPQRRGLAKSENLLSKAIAAWKAQPADERAGLYRVRGDCYSAMGLANQAYLDYDMAVKLLEGPGKDAADPDELPTSLLGRARALQSMVKTAATTESTAATGTGISSSDKQRAQQSASDYERYLKMVSREEWDTDEELLKDGAMRNPYAAWEWGSVLRLSSDWKRAAQAHTMASQAFEAIGDKPRSVMALTDAGVDWAAAHEYDRALTVLKEAVFKTPGVESRETALLQRVVAKEGEGRMALAALLWSNSNGGAPDGRQEAETILGDACIRLDQLQADAVSRKPKASAANTEPVASLLGVGIDDNNNAMNPLQVSCFRFKNPAFLNQLGWPQDLQEKVIKLETLR